VPVPKVCREFAIGPLFIGAGGGGDEQWTKNQMLYLVRDGQATFCSESTNSILNSFPRAAAAFITVSS